MKVAFNTLRTLSELLYTMKMNSFCFFAAKTSQALNLISSPQTVSVHIWGKNSRKQEMKSVDSGLAYSLLAANHCPEIYKVNTTYAYCYTTILLYNIFSFVTFHFYFSLFVESSQGIFATLNAFD